MVMQILSRTNQAPFSNGIITKSLSPDDITESISLSLVLSVPFPRLFRVLPHIASRTCSCYMRHRYDMPKLRGFRIVPRAFPSCEMLYLTTSCVVYSQAIEPSAVYDPMLGSSAKSACPGHGRLFRPRMRQITARPRPQSSADVEGGVPPGDMN